MLRFSAAPPLAQSALTAPDYVALVVYLVATVAIGAWLCRGKATLGSYFLADRKTHWILACVSIIATDISALSYMGVPGWIFEKDLKYSAGAVLYPLVMFVVVLIFVPLFVRLNVFTVYEYLEKRFHPAARTVAALLFLFLRGVHLAGAIYIPAVAFSTFTKIPEFHCIFMIGALTTAYTLKGGMRAVILTDFLQFMVMFGSLLLMIGLLLHGFHWDVPAIWSYAEGMTAPKTGGPHTRLLDWTFDLKTEATVWSILAFYMVYNVGTYGTDQVIVQRYFTMTRYRDIAKSVIGAGLLTTVSVALLAFTGLLLVVYYGQNPQLAASIRKPDDVLPHFVVHTLPAGIRGIILAAILATTMSALSAGLNSFATVGVMDLYTRYGKGKLATEAHALRVAKLFTLLSGVGLTLLALWVSQTRTPVLEKINALASIFIGPVTGIFFLGVWTKRANMTGLVAGCVAGLIVSLVLNYWPPLVDAVNWMWMPLFSCSACLVVGYLASFFAAPPVPDRLKTAQESPALTETAASA